RSRLEVETIGTFHGRVAHDGQCDVRPLWPARLVAERQLSRRRSEAVHTQLALTKVYVPELLFSLGGAGLDGSIGLVSDLGELASPRLQGIEQSLAQESIVAVHRE